MKKPNPSRERSLSHLVDLAENLYLAHLKEVNDNLRTEGLAALPYTNIEEWRAKYSSSLRILEEIVVGRPSGERVAFEELAIRIGFYESLIAVYHKMLEDVAGAGALYVDDKIREKLQTKQAAEASAEVRRNGRALFNSTEIKKRWNELEEKGWPINARNKKIQSEMKEQYVAGNPKPPNIRTVELVTAALKTQLAALIAPPPQ